VAQFGIAPFPAAGGQIALQAVKLRGDALQTTESGNAGTNLFVEVSFRSLPIRAEESVDAVEWNWQGLHIDRTKHRAKQFHRRENPAIDVKNLWEVVPNQPEAVRVRVPGQNDDAVSCNTSAFLEPSSLVVPMVHRQNGEYDVECSILKGQRLGNCSHCRRGRRQALTEHYNGWLNSDNTTSNGFV